MTVAGRRLDRRGMLIPVALGVVLLLLTTAVTAWGLSSSGRRSVELVRAHRWARMAATSAFDETALWMVETFSVPMIDRASSARDLRKLMLDGAIDLRAGGGRLPLSWTPALTRAEFKGQGIEIGEVTVDTTPWSVQTSEPKAGFVSVLEGGLLTFRTTVVVRYGSVKITRHVRARRYALARPRKTDGPPGPDGDEVIYTSPFDLVREEDDKELP